METQKYIAYIRISKDKKGTRGLSEEAQQRAVESLVNSRGGELLQTFSEIESGKKNTRPAFLLAIECAKRKGATLIIAKLDRLSRNAGFILNLRDSGVDFIAADMPDANKMTVGIMALIAENERDAISSRTKAALESKRLRGWKPVYRDNLGESGRRNAVDRLKMSANMNHRNRTAAALSIEMSSNGATLQQIAAKLNESGYQTRNGCSFHATTVKRLIERFR